jgi:ribosome-associated translation inhibitor RaiA
MNSVGEVFVETSSSGEVSKAARDYAATRMAELVAIAHRRVLFARSKLVHAPDPAVEKPCRVDGVLDVDGTLLRSTGVAPEMSEAIDVMHNRLRDRIERLNERQDLERHRPLSLHAQPGEWRHQNLPTERPRFLDRSIGERDVVRRKPLGQEELTVEEAAWDMHQLDYDFFLFPELHTSIDSLLYRSTDGLCLSQLAAGSEPPPTGVLEVTLDESRPPRLRINDAVEWLDAYADPFVFFAEWNTGRGAVLYRRYDGNYGLLGPLGSEQAASGETPETHGSAP